MSSPQSIPRWVEQLQSEGRYTFTRSEAEARTGRSFVAVQSALRRLKQQGRIASPKRGFYVIVPPEYRATGSPPASWFIDELMGHLDQPYYVGLLTAAAAHGAAHQQPMVFQVVTSKPTRAMSAGRVSIELFMSGKVEQTPVVEKQTETGTMRVATAEVTAFDLVRYPAGAGHLSNVATVLSELAERIDVEALVTLAPSMRLPDVQRLGFLLESVGTSGRAEPLAAWLRGHCPRTVLLRPGGLPSGDRDPRWRVLVNEKLEPDL
jgi:predicted transcriptional regulator of viral defense system